MNYKKLNDRIIENAKSQLRCKGKSEYYELYHIVPTCIGGTDDINNLVLLTAREHFLIHWILTKIYPDNEKIIFAFHRMCNFNLNCQHDKKSNLYKYSREVYVEMLKNNTDWKEKLRLAVLGRIWIKKDNISLRIYSDEFEKYEKLGYVKGRIIKYRSPHSIETKNKISKRHKGRISPTKGKTLKTKGLTYEEIYGKETALKLKDQRRLKMIETNNKTKLNKI